MTTEREIIYSILNTARNEEHNIDEVLTERLLRNYLKTHRASLLKKYFRDGHLVSDEVFQRVPLKLKKQNGEYVGQLPKIIRSIKDYGYYVESFGVRIPVINSEQYYLSKPQGKMYGTTEGNNFKMQISYNNLCSKEYKGAVRVYEYFYQKELKAKKNKEDLSLVEYEIDLIAVLENPDDDPNYDWENSIYPFPSELIQDLKYEVLRREINIMPHNRRDEISNSRNDSLSNRTANVSAQENV